MSEENKEKSDLEVVDKKEETEEKPLWKAIVDEFKPKEIPTTTAGKIIFGIKKAWKFTVGLCGVILIVMMITGKFDQLAYDIGIAGKPDNISNDYTVVESTSNTTDEYANYTNNNTIYGTEEERDFLSEYGVDLGIFQSEAHIMFVYECARGLYDVGIRTAEDAKIYCENNDYDYRENPELYENYQYDAFIVMAASYDTRVTYRIAERFGANTDAIIDEIMNTVSHPIVNATTDNSYSSKNEVANLEFVNYGYDIDTNDMYTMDDISTFVSNAREEYRNGIEPLYLSDDIYLDINDYGNYGQYIGMFFLLEGTVDTYAVDDRTGFMMWLSLPVIISDGGYNGAFLNTTIIDSSNLENEDGTNISIPAVFVGRDYYGTPYFVALD